MARPMRMKDKKNYRKRIFSNHSGDYSGAESTDRSKYLAIKYDIEHNILITDEQKEFMEEYEKEHG